MADKKMKDLKTPNSSQGESGVMSEESVYEKPKKQSPIKDKTGWQVRPENKMILEGNLSPADKGNTIIPEGFDQPKSNKPSHDKGVGNPK